MSLIIATTTLRATTHAALRTPRERVSAYRTERDVQIDVASTPDDALQELSACAAAAGDAKSARAIDAILAARSGRFDAPVPSFKAFQGMLEEFLRTDAIDGWIYARGPDDMLYPELVVSVSFQMGRDGSDPCVKLRTVAFSWLDHSHASRTARQGMRHTSYAFGPASTARKRMADILAAHNLFKETPELKRAYLASMERYGAMRDAYAKQFRFSGSVLVFPERTYHRRGERMENRKLVHDLHPSDVGAMVLHADTELPFSPDGSGDVPEHPLILGFDLGSHEHYWVHADYLTPYVYDHGLRTKLILPPTHRDLLDVLTTDVSAFTADIIEGKSAGNVILCKGIPGVGKTLTAEIYAELTERPLYTVHAGTLGTSAKEIAESLAEVFARGKRWGCVLLIDEADVFVARRGMDINHNAIVAEFLRTLEYFDGLMFMTTNRPEDIDEAIISRCAAVIEYQVPSADNAAAVWRVMAAQYNVTLTEPMIADLLETFPAITPRDIKMLLRLAIRVAGGADAPLGVDVFRRCAMFRAVHMAPVAEVVA